MNITVNGNDMNLEVKEMTVNDLISHLKVEGKVMAAAINMEVVKKDRWKDQEIKNGDKVELLQFVGGG